MSDEKCDPKYPFQWASDAECEQLTEDEVLAVYPNIIIESTGSSYGERWRYLVTPEGVLLRRHMAATDLWNGETWV